MSSTSHLAAIMFTDIAGFTQLSAHDEESALKLLETQRKLFKPIVAEFGGKWLKEMGDGLLLSFSGSKQAVRCAIRIQQATKGHTNLNVRIGIHQGDIVEKDGDVFGDDVNIASRIEPFAAAGGIAISHKVLGDISGSPEFITKYLGKPRLKGVSQKVEVYCIISHGLPAPKRSEISAKLEKKTSRWLYYGILLILTVAAGIWIYFPERVKQSIDSIAVLPLENLSNDPGQEYFADAMTEALIGELAKYGTLTVISRHSVMQYKHSKLSMPAISKDLGADAIVEGTVFREGDSVRVSIGLIHAAVDQSMWRQEFDRKLENILELHRELAQAVAEQIKATLTPFERAHLDPVRQIDPIAYDAYVKGRFHWYLFTPQDMAQAVDYYEFAIERDPDFAAAYVGWADAIATPSHMGFVPSEEAYPKAREAVLHALELDQNLAEAHDMMGRIHFAYDWAPVSAEKEFRRAIELNPSYPDVRAVYSQLLSALDRPEEAIMQARKATELDPRNNFFQANLVMRIAEAGNIDESISMLLDRSENGKSRGANDFALWQLYFQKGDYTRALQHAQAVWASTGDTALIAALKKNSVDESYQDMMKRAANVLVSRSDSRYVSPFSIALFFANADEEGLALDWLEKAIDKRDTSIVYAKKLGAFHQLREKERFRKILERINLD